jgi:predicted XRE-type DNA-binding protein
MSIRYRLCLEVAEPLTQNEMKQSSIEWLMEIDKSRAITIEEWQQAKEMEKEQMVDFAFKYGDLTTREIADAFDKEYKNNKK